MDEDKIMRDQVRSIDSHWQLLLVVLLLAGAAVSRAEFEVEPRLSTTSQGQNSQRGGVGDRMISHDEYEPLVTAGVRQKPGRTTAQQKLTGASQDSTTQTPNIDFWFFDVDIELFFDFDHDGYFYGIDLWFDVDTVFTVADVYAVVQTTIDRKTLSVGIQIHCEYFNTQNTIRDAGAGIEHGTQTIVLGFERRESLQAHADGKPLPSEL